MGEKRESIYVPIPICHLWAAGGWGSLVVNSLALVACLASDHWSQKKPFREKPEGSHISKAVNVKGM